jgi:hypothetical protein
MPSRRQFFASAGAALTTASSAGCLGLLDATKTGALQLKALSLTWETNGRTYQNEPLRLLFDRDRNSLTGRYDPRVVGDSVGASGEVTVGEWRHEKLRRHVAVEYVLGVCGEDFVTGDEPSGCRNTHTSRAEFNSVQVGDRPTVTLDDHEFAVESVEPDVYTVETTEVHTFDVDAAFGDEGSAPEVP